MIYPVVSHELSDGEQLEMGAVADWEAAERPRCKEKSPFDVGLAGIPFGACAMCKGPDPKSEDGTRSLFDGVVPLQK